MARPSEELQPEIGFWWCFCCLHDLYQIETQEDIEEILSCREYGCPRVWRTREEALKELVPEESIP